MNQMVERFLQPAGSRLALGLLLAYLAAAAGVWAGAWGSDFNVIVAGMWEPPSRDHWLGTNLLGQDILARSLTATARAFEIGLTIAGISTLTGASLGALAGYRHRGWVDQLVLWLAGTVDAIPFYLLVIAVAFALQSHPMAMHLAMAGAFWTTTARVVRAEIIRLGQAGFVEAARASGSRPTRIVIRHMLPHTSPLLIVQATIVFVAAVKAEVILSFLGLGPASGVSWGIMIAESTQEILAGQYMNFIVASGLLFGLVLALSLLADRLQQALDPRHGRHNVD
jgi:ABC-type dipeptide/oligopeptide/nickel transport system permease subunit